jgi:hypothetical protein
MEFDPSFSSLELRQFRLQGFDPVVLLRAGHRLSEGGHVGVRPSDGFEAKHVMGDDSVDEACFPILEEEGQICWVDPRIGSLVVTTLGMKGQSVGKQGLVRTETV